MVNSRGLNRFSQRGGHMGGSDRGRGLTRVSRGSANRGGRGRGFVNYDNISPRQTQTSSRRSPSSRGSSGERQPDNSMQAEVPFLGPTSPSGGGYTQSNGHTSRSMNGYHHGSNEQNARYHNHPTNQQNGHNYGRNYGMNGHQSGHYSERPSFNSARGAHAMSPPHHYRNGNQQPPIHMPPPYINGNRPTRGRREMSGGYPPNPNR